MKRLLPVLLSAIVVWGPSATRAASQETAPYKPGGNVSSPRILKEVKPTYTTDAQRNQISGRVMLECVVRADGTPSDIHVTQSLDPGLDAEAIKALGQWRFRPGEKDGKPVDVKVDIEMTFTLRDKGSAAAAPATTAEEPAPDVVYKPGNGVSAPVVVKDVKPPYPPAAMKSRVQGAVKIQCVVLADGSVGDVRVTRSLDPEIDREAIATLKKWTFKPGMKDGQPVAVQVEVEMTFAMK